MVTLRCEWKEGMRVKTACEDGSSFFEFTVWRVYSIQSIMYLLYLLHCKHM